MRIVAPESVGSTMVTMAWVANASRTLAQEVCTRWSRMNWRDGE